MLRPLLTSTYGRGYSLYELTLLLKLHELLSYDQSSKIPFPVPCQSVGSPQGPGSQAIQCGPIPENSTVTSGMYSPCQGQSSTSFDNGLNTVHSILDNSDKSFFIKYQYVFLFPVYNTLYQ